MDEITLVNLLNKICEKNSYLNWKLNCKYNDGQDHSIMQISLFNSRDNHKAGSVTFSMDTGSVIEGKYESLMPFQPKVQLVDALLDILNYENSKVLTSVN